MYINIANNLFNNSNILLLWSYNSLTLEIAVISEYDGSDVGTILYIILCSRLAEVAQRREDM